MSKTAKPPVLTPLGLATLPGFGMNFTVYEKGADIFESIRMGGAVEVAAGDGVRKPAVVQAVQVGPLIDLILNFGLQAGLMIGRPYTPLALVQSMTDASADDVLDVTKLYTAVTITLAPEPGPLPTAG